MYERLLNKYAVNQIGIVVDDVEQAARDHSALFGSGPFFILDHIGCAKATWKGEEIGYDVKLAYGQHGGLQVEFIQSYCQDPSPYTVPGTKGFNHVSIWTDDVEATKAEFEAAGFEVPFRMESGGGLVAYYADCREKWNCYVEFHNPIQQVWDFYANAAKEWDGEELFKEFPRRG